jgi:hypothetical protein
MESVNNTRPILAHVGEWEIVPYENIHAVSIDSGEPGNMNSCTIILNNSKEIYIAGEKELMAFIEDYKEYLKLMDALAVVVPNNQE